MVGGWVGGMFGRGLRGRRGGAIWVRMLGRCLLLLVVWWIQVRGGLFRAIRRMGLGRLPSFEWVSRGQISWALWLSSFGLMLVLAGWIVESWWRVADLHVEFGD